MIGLGELAHSPVDVQPLPATWELWVKHSVHGLVLSDLVEIASQRAEPIFRDFVLSASGSSIEALAL